MKAELFSQPGAIGAVSASTPVAASVDEHFQQKGHSADNASASDKKLAALVASMPANRGGSEVGTKTKKPKKKPEQVLIDESTLFDDQAWSSLMDPLKPGETEAERVKRVRKEAEERSRNDLAEMEAIRAEAARAAKQKKNHRLSQADIAEMSAIRSEAARHGNADLSSMKNIRDQVSNGQPITTPKTKKSSATMSADEAEMAAMRAEALAAGSSSAKQSTRASGSARAAKPADPPKPTAKAATPTTPKKDTAKAKGGMSDEDAKMMRKLRKQALRGELDDLT